MGPRYSPPPGAGSGHRRPLTAARGYFESVPPHTRAGKAGAGGRRGPRQGWGDPGGNGAARAFLCLGSLQQLIGGGQGCEAPGRGERPHDGCRTSQPAPRQGAPLRLLPSHPVALPVARGDSRREGTADHAPPQRGNPSRPRAAAAAQPGRRRGGRAGESDGRSEPNRRGQDRHPGRN